LILNIASDLKKPVIKVGNRQEHHAAHLINPETGILSSGDIILIAKKKAGFLGQPQLTA
jgi:hypothetical protein